MDNQNQFITIYIVTDLILPPRLKSYQTISYTLRMAIDHVTISADDDAIRHAAAYLCIESRSLKITHYYLDG